MEIEAIKAMHFWLRGEGKRPPGFKYLGQGTERKAYRGADGWVYKFDKFSDYWEVGHQPNMEEWRGYKRLKRAKRLPEGWAIPYTELIRFGPHRVIKMQYIKGRGVFINKAVEGAWLRPRVWDLGPSNTRKCSSTGIKYLIDLQY